jgi:hypothetical protein
LKVKELFVITLIFSSSLFSQTDISIGGSLGGGSFSGNSVSVGGFSTSIFIEANLPLFEEVFPRLSFVYTKDFNALLPNTNQPYNPFLMGFNLKGVTTQYFDNKMFLEEGVGVLVINDRTFSDTDSWEYGAILSLARGFDLRNYDLKGFKIGAGVEYGITFTGTLPQYFSLFLQFQYTF